MSILIGTHARIAVTTGAPFQSIREVVARGEEFGPESTIKEKLCGSILRCQKGMGDQAAIECLHCPRLVNFVPQSRSMVVRCLWTESDYVEDLMTLESEFVSVAPATPITDADAIAREKGVRHLLVVEAGRLSGILCRCDLRNPSTNETVAGRVNHCPWSISPKTTLSQSERIMREREVDILPVIADGELVGLVTQGDLRRAGALLTTKTCCRDKQPWSRTDSQRFR